jgi:hypothetical protein
MEQAMKGLFAELERVQKAIRAPAPLNHLGSEIRARLAGMSPERRQKVLAEGDDTIIGAVTSGPAFLSGLTKVEFKLHEQEWQKDSRRRPVVFGASPPL